MNKAVKTQVARLRAVSALLVLVNIWACPPIENPSPLGLCRRTNTTNPSAEKNQMPWIIVVAIFAAITIVVWIDRFRAHCKPLRPIPTIFSIEYTVKAESEREQGWCEHQTQQVESRNVPSSPQVSADPKSLGWWEQGRPNTHRSAV